ncbi:MAG TPA: efflux RND transporter periplasmic adaptor subunit [Holosporales bacterium]|nr:efflux RND transporter periplasmic adaptor subunit [Holosporales bacterium]
MTKKTLPLILFGILLLGGLFFYYQKTSAEKESVITLYGNVDIRDVNLSFRVFGRIKTMLHEEGAQVKKGDLVALLDKRPYLDEVQIAQAGIEQATVAFNNAERTYKRKKELAGKKFASTQDLDDIQAKRDELKTEIIAAKAKLQNAQTSLDDTEIYAPANGTILTRVKEEGAIVNAGESTYVLALSTPIWIRAYVHETDLGRIYQGMEAKITTDANPDEPYIGHIGFISPVAEFTPKAVETPELRTQLVYRLRIIVANTDQYLRQGMPVSVHIDRTQKMPEKPNTTASSKV